MPSQPSRSQVHLDAILSNISVAYIQAHSRYIAQQVFPVVPVGKQSDKFYTYDKDDWFRDEAQRRADATESAGSGYDLGTDQYSCDVFAMHKDIGYQARNNADSPINLDAEAAEFVTQRILLRQEIAFVNDFFTTGVWANERAGVASGETAGVSFRQWSDYANSDPIEDIEEGKEQVIRTTGLEANTLVLGYGVFRRFKNHPAIVDRIKYTSTSTVTPDMMAAMLDIDRVLVSSAIRATTPEGAATPAYDFTHGGHALLCHTTPSPGLLTPSAGYTFAWDGVSGGLGLPVGVSTFYLDKIKADRVEAEAAWDNKVISADLGYFMSDVV